MLGELPFQIQNSDKIFGISFFYTTFYEINARKKFKKYVLSILNFVQDHRTCFEFYFQVMVLNFETQYPMFEKNLSL